MCHSENQKVYVGGHRYPQFIGMSFSKKNFEGCLQQVYFQVKRSIGSWKITNSLTMKKRLNRIPPNKDGVQNFSEELEVLKPFYNSLKIKIKLQFDTVGCISNICINIVCH